MVNKSLLKKLSLIFAILCVLGFIAVAACATTLPSVEVYNTVFGTVRRTTPFIFNTNYLSSAILLAFGAFWGFGLFGALKKEKSPVKETKIELPPVEEAKAEETKPETEEKPQE